MKLSHESKVRLGVGVGAFVLIIGLVFGISRTLIHFDGPWDLDDVVSGLSSMDDVVDDDDFMNDGGKYSAQPQQLSSATFDADQFRYLDFDIAAATVDVKVVDDNKVRVIERGRVAKGVDASKAATQNIASVEDSTLKVSRSGSDDGKAIDRSVTVELPRRVAEHLKGINAHVGSGDLQIAGVICDGLDLFLGAGDVEFTGSVTDALSAEVGRCDVRALPGPREVDGRKRGLGRCGDNGSELYGLYGEPHRGQRRLRERFPSAWLRWRDHIES